jgi:hypothetical protein
MFTFAVHLHSSTLYQGIFPVPARVANVNVCSRQGLLQVDASQFEVTHLR